MISQYGNLAKASTTMIVPAEMGDLSRFLATALAITGKGEANTPDRQ
ncbi:MAG: band-7 C-terminal domain-containing protein [Gammaproteobacteria bacterium]